MDSNQPTPSTKSQSPASLPPSSIPSEPVSTIFTPTPPKKRKKGLIIGGIVAAAIVLFSGVGVLGYNVWYQNPERVVFDALMNAFKAKTVSGNGELTITSDDVAVKVTFEGKGDGSDGLIDTTVIVDGKGDAADISLDVKAALLVKGDTIYFKLDNVRKAVDNLAASLGDAPEFLDPIIKKIDGQWISVKASDYEDVSKELAEQQRCVTKVFEDVSSSDSMKQGVISLYKENKFLNIDKQLKPKSVNETGSLGYEISVNTDATKSFVKGLSDTDFGKALKECDDSVSFDDLADAVTSASDSMGGNGTTELWVSRFGHQITEITSTDKSDDFSSTFVFRPVFNKDVVIETPSDVITVKQLQKDIEKAFEEYSTQYYSNEYDLEDDAESASPFYNLN